MIRVDILDRKEDILKWISNNESKAFISRELECKADTLERYLIKMGIEYRGNKPSRGKASPHKKSSFLYLNTDKFITSHKLRLKLLEDGIKEHKCELCGNTEWNEEQIPLELHHINGVHKDNRLENLQLLCPNCHAQTDSHAGKKNKKAA